MELVELTLQNFRRFTEARFSFCRGLNLVWGPNESGKSTLHEAICSALFGRTRGQEVENWNGGSCSVALTFRSGGKAYVLEHRLSEATCSLGTLTAGGELIDIINDKDAVIEAAANHLGIPLRTVFDNTVSIRQTEVSRITAAGLTAVGSEIQRVLTGTAQTSAGEAINKLKRTQSDIKGRPRPTKPREYDTICERLQALAQEAARAREKRARIRDLEAEQVELEAKTERHSERLAALSELLERHTRWSELKSRQSEADKLHSETFATLKRLKDHLADLKYLQKELEDYADLIGKVDEIAENLSKLESRRAELQARLGELETAEQGQVTEVGRAPVSWLTGGAVLALVGLAVGLAVDLRALLLLIPASVLVIRYMHLHAADTAGEVGRLVRLTASARHELSQVEAEEQSILRYVKCPNPARAWARIKTYRSQASRAHELEIVLKASLSGRTIDDWEAQEAELARELSALNHELEEEFPDYAPTTEETEAWRKEHLSLQQTAPIARARLHEVKGELEAETRNAKDLAILEGELEFLHTRKSELEFTYRAYGEAITALHGVMQDVSSEYLPTLSEKAVRYLGNITAGRYTSIHVTTDWQIRLECVDRSDVPGSMVSAGTLDQLYFALRLGCGELLSAGRALPIILDDPFVNFDRRRLDNVLNLLEEVARTNQVLLLTHDPHTLEWARDVHATGRIECMVHELPHLASAVA